MLDNPVYVGRFIWKGVEYEGKHVPLITPELFMKVQAIKHGRKGGEYQGRTFAFTGLLTCGYCGCAITAEIKKGKYVYYHCTGGRGKCQGQGAALREEDIDRQLADVVSGLKMDDRVFATLRKGLKAAHEDEREYHARALANLNGQLTKVSNRIRQIYIDKLDGQIDTATYDEFKTKFEAEREVLRSQIAAHEKADKDYLEYGARLLELAQTAYLSYYRRSPHEKRRLLNFVLSNCVLMSKRLIPEYRKPFDLIASAARDSRKGGSLDPDGPGFPSRRVPPRGFEPLLPP
ncbi:MAG: recombinase zinc beta ribbon domain-containing protein [Candidatus Sericytochromatia bacterium]|nr:recombinase zinc beta ribbon domain-containing protein [Candidatus Tanganyikabacteria bacterium]